jgi:hypothetical protein
MNLTIVAARLINNKQYPLIISANGKEIYREEADGFWSMREYDSKGNKTSCIRSDGYWDKHEYDSNSNEVFFRTSRGFWMKCEYDEMGNTTYLNNSDGFWMKCEYDDNGKEAYYENSLGQKRGTPKSQIVELTLADIATKLGIPIETLRIKE